jgi:ABC-type transport system involved in cytochrome c biogenesis permease subunit
MSFINSSSRIIRIILTTAIYAVFNFFSCWFYDAAGFLEPISQLYECFALCSIFLLFIQYVVPHEESRLDFFQNLERQGRKGNKKHDFGSLKWFYVSGHLKAL